MSVSRPRSAASVGHHDAPLIGERATTRGRSAMERGDERGGMKRALLRPRRDERGICLPVSRASTW
jgi:hypothetical protein